MTLPGLEGEREGRSAAFVMAHMEGDG